MEIPERLIGDHKALEMYGHNMKNKHGNGFKRHTKLDDTKLCLYMDAFVPKLKTWVRIEVDQAREDNDRRRSRAIAAAGNKDLLSTLSDGEDNNK